MSKYPSGYNEMPHRNEVERYKSNKQGGLTMDIQASGPVAAMEQSPIQLAINKLDTGIQALRANIERLETKLTPVLTQPEPTSPNDEKKPEISPMETQLDLLHMKFIAECVKLEEIIQRLQI